MKKRDVMTRLQGCKIPVHEDSATPANGNARPLPYLIIHADDTQNGDDCGFIAIVSTSWQLSLCTAAVSDDLEQLVRRALVGVAPIAATRQQKDNYYQTDFEFTTTEIMKGA